MWGARAAAERDGRADGAPLRGSSAAHECTLVMRPSPWLSKARLFTPATRHVVANEWQVFLTVAALVWVTRLPFIDAGYGAIRDAWRVASAARLIATSHDYWASRFPPHPVQEIASATIWWSGAVGLNMATAVLSSLGIAFFALTARRLGYADWALATAALALTPQIYIASTSTIDYMWALSFIFASLYVLVRGKPLLAGLLLGIAIGSRITSAAMLLPLTLIAARGLDGHRDQRLGRIVVLWIAACATGAILFVPALSRGKFSRLLRLRRENRPRSSGEARSRSGGSLVSSPSAWPSSMS
jgi:hypothetical protein